MRKTKRVTKRILASIMSVAMIIGTLTGAGVVNTETVKAKDYGISNPRINADGSVTWDKVKFGNYKQSVEIGEPEPIKWRILSIDDNNNALLLADKGLDCKPYNEEYESVTWETCTLRTWLNEDFYNEAFNESEKAAIKQVTVKNDDNTEYGTEGGNDTTDKVYLLSIEEASNSLYGFDNIFSSKSTARECKATDYARMNGAYHSSRFQYRLNCYWWLRSPGLNRNLVAYGNDDGWGLYNGTVNFNDYAVRPALQINLSSSLVEDAGEVTSDGTVTDLEDGYNNPKVTDDGSVWDCVYFGRYRQNNISEKEPVEWRVLSVDGEEALLLADKGLDCKPYNEENEDVTWETSTLRTWLNEDFYNEAFNESEKSAIKQVTVKNDDNPEYGTEGGNDTTDKVYLLSIEEASNSAYGFCGTYNIASVTRECMVTDYAYMNGVKRINSSSGCVGTGYWWLRSPGSIKYDAAGVSGDGWGYYSGGVVFDVAYAIRPALRINLSSSVWENAGTVSIGAGSIDINQPIQTSDSTKTPSPSPSKAPVINATPVPVPVIDNTQSADDKPQLKTIKLSSVICKRNTTKISGKVSVSGATVKIKVGSKAYKKAIVKGKKFTLKVAKLKKKTKVVIKVTKSGYKSLSKTYKVK